MSNVCPLVVDFVWGKKLCNLCEQVVGFVAKIISNLCELRCWFCDQGIEPRMSAFGRFREEE